MQQGFGDRLAEELLAQAQFVTDLAREEKMPSDIFPSGTSQRAAFSRFQVSNGTRVRKRMEYRKLVGPQHGLDLGQPFRLGGTGVSTNCE